MSWYIRSYLVDAEKIKKIFGCKNKLFLEKIVIKLNDFLDDLDSDYSEQTNLEKNSRAVLIDIINGKITLPELDFMYTLIYERLCDVFGEQIFSPNDEYSVEYFKALQLKHSAIIAIPFPTRVPMTHHIAIKNLKHQKEWFLGLTKPNEMSQKEFDAEQSDYAFAFDEAIAKNKDLVFVMD
jgi:hypothetical protein